MFLFLFFLYFCGNDLGLRFFLFNYCIGSCKQLRCSSCCQNFWFSGGGARVSIGSEERGEGSLWMEQISRRSSAPSGRR